MHTFHFKAGKLARQTKVEIDRRWVRIITSKGKQHIDFASLESLHYMAMRSHGMITGQLYLKERGKKTASLGASGFGADRNFEDFLRAASAVLVAIAEVRPDLQVVMEGPASTRIFLAVFVLVATTGVVVANVVFDMERDSMKIAIAVSILLFVLGYLLFHYGPLRKKPEPVSAREVGQQLVEQAG